MHHDEGVSKEKDENAFHAGFCSISTFSSSFLNSVCGDALTEMAFFETALCKTGGRMRKSRTFKGHYISPLFFSL
jgi:hypothetical protein